MVTNFFRKWKNHERRVDHRFPVEHTHHLKILMMGPPGSGKSTQAQNVSEHFDIPLISAGKLLRNSRDIRMNSETVGNYLKQGDLVPDPLVNQLLEARLDGDREYVLEGYPRNLPQAEHLDSIGRLNRIIMLSVPREELRHRLSGRRVCEECGAVFHLEYNSPERGTICDECGGFLYQRDDDTPEAVAHRLEVYKELTWPVLERYRGRGPFVTVNGEGTPGEVWDRIRDVVKHRPLTTGLSA